MRYTLPPLANTYWVEPGRLLAGEYPGSLDTHKTQEKIRTLEQAGVGVFIDLTTPADGLKPYVSHLNQAIHEAFPIRDVSIPESPAWTRTILDAIDEHIAQGRIPYVHCWGGIGRTGLIIGCWLVRQGLTGEQALSALRERWMLCTKSATRETPETGEQVRYILHWREPGE